MTNNNEKNGNRSVLKSSNRKNRFLFKTNLVIIAMLAVLMVLSTVPVGTGSLSLSDEVDSFDIRTTASPAPVDLGSASGFAILSKSGVTTTGTTHVLGDIGVSPISSTAITGFGLTMDSSGTFSTSVLVEGRIYASDYTSPTPSMLTTAIGDMETAYADASGRTTPDHTELGSGEIGGMTLAPGLYKWGTGLSISTDLTISGSSSDVWIFQIAETLGIADGKKVILSNGANPENIFWQVGGQVTLGTTSTMNGIILSESAIVMNTGATLNGRAMSQTEVTLDASAVISVIDDVPPTVTSTVPSDEATGVAYNSALTATFSEAMKVSTLNDASFTLKQGITVIDGTVDYVGVMAIFTPLVNLTPDTEYTANISTEAEDRAGNALVSNYTWSFTTGTSGDTIAPTVVSVTPNDEATGVALNGVITIAFSETMNPLTMTNTVITLAQGETVIDGIVSYSGTTAIFSPNGNMVADTEYNVTVTTGAEDLAGNALTADYIWSFTTTASSEDAGIPLWVYGVIALVIIGAVIGVIFLRK